MQKRIAKEEKDDREKDDREAVSKGELPKKIKDQMEKEANAIAKAYIA